MKQHRLFSTVYPSTHPVHFRVFNAPCYATRGKHISDSDPTSFARELMTCSCQVRIPSRGRRSTPRKGCRRRSGVVELIISSKTQRHRQSMYFTEVTRLMCDVTHQTSHLHQLVNRSFSKSSALRSRQPWRVPHSVCSLHFFQSYGGDYRSELASRSYFNSVPFSMSKKRSSV